MAYLTFLNERSHVTGATSGEVGRQLFTDLVATLRAVKTLRPDLVLHSAAPLGEVQLGDDLTIGSLRGNGQTVDLWRWLRGLQNRAPFHVGLGVLPDDGVDYEYGGTRAVGLGLAHALDGLAVSLAHDPWRVSNVELTRLTLNEAGAIDADPVQVRNAADPADVEAHRAHCTNIAFEVPADGLELWEKRVERFPRLKFMPQTEAQITSLKAGAAELYAINIRLCELQQSLAGWDIEAEALPEFRSKATPEHEQRAKKFLAKNLEGVEVCFDLHLRYTPGAGRIHLWCDRSAGTATIYHVGEKVP